MANHKKTRNLPSRYCDQRVAVGIDTIIIHSMHSPDSHARFSAESCKAWLDQAEVSVHYIIDREGEVWRLVEEEMRAWHAGMSRMPDPLDWREGVNHFSIGIELLASEDSGYTEGQYRTLAELTAEIVIRHPIRDIYGHSEISQWRKSDPWGFDWARYRADLAIGGVGASRLRVGGKPLTPP